jgi:branched-chain amino acid transport system ATP-binding protein
MSELLVLERLSKSFEQLRAVDAVSLAVPRGKILGLIGPNGSGKSTLFNLIAGLERADAGRIVFDGREITHRTADQIFQLGLVRGFQDPALFFRMTVLDNMLLPGKGQRGERATLAPFQRAWARQEAALATTASALLEQVQLRGQYSQLAANISGGQMKLLDLSRGLMSEPKMLLLDEPTAGVSPKLARTIFERVAQLRQEQGVTFFIIEHRLEILFDFCDAVYVMHNGEVVAHGTPSEIAANARVREIYFGS